MLKKINLRSLFANSWVLLFLAIVIAGGLTFFLYKYLNDRERKLKADIVAQTVRSGVQVVVPSSDVPVGTPLSSSVFVAREIPADMVYDDMIRPDDFPKYRTSRLVRPLRRGLPLRTADIDALSGRDFSDMLPPGQRALTVEIDTVNSTALLLRPGNRVDLYWLGKAFHEDQASANQRVAQLIMPDVLVLATGQDMRARDAGDADQMDKLKLNNNSAMSRKEGVSYSTVTLQVPVDDVARIALAQKIGGLRLILRNSGDKGGHGPSLVQESDVFENHTPESPTTSVASAGPSRQVVELITGGGASNSNLIVSPATPSTSTQNAPAAGASADASPNASASAQRQPSVYEQANAIAQQLQNVVAPSTSPSPQ